MKLNLVLALNGPDSVATLAGNIERIYPERYRRKLSDKPAWIVVDNALTRDISDKLGISSGDGGISALVSTVTSYFGRAEPDLWEWMSLRMEERPDGAPQTDADAA